MQNTQLSLHLSHVFLNHAISCIVDLLVRISIPKNRFHEGNITTTTTTKSYRPQKVHGGTEESGFELSDGYGANSGTRALMCESEIYPTVVGKIKFLFHDLESGLQLRKVLVFVVV
jgi:hypothetical protein